MKTIVKTLLVLATLFGVYVFFVGYGQYIEIRERGERRTPEGRKAQLERLEKKASLSAGLGGGISERQLDRIHFLKKQVEEDEIAARVNESESKAAASAVQAAKDRAEKAAIQAKIEADAPRLKAEAEAAKRKADADAIARKYSAPK